MSKPVETSGEEGKSKGDYWNIRGRQQQGRQQQGRQQQGRQQQQGGNNSRKPKTGRSPTTARTARNVGETQAAVRTSTAEGMLVTTTETLAKAGTPETSTAVRTTTAAGTPATLETITTADAAKVLAKDSLHVFFTSCLSFYTPSQFLLYHRVLAVFLLTLAFLFTPLPSFFYITEYLPSFY
jgi:hypothetical protein